MSQSLGIKHYWNYFLEYFMLSVKRVTEFKPNLYAVCLFAPIDVILSIVFSYVLSQSIGDVVGFGFIDFLLIFVFLFTFNDFMSMFYRSKHLESYILFGDMNNILKIPGSPFLNFFLKIGYNSFIFTIFQVLIYTPIILYFGSWTFLSLFLSSFFMFLLAIIFVFFIYFLESFSWRFVKVGFFLKKVYLDNIQNDVRAYPMQFFRSSPLFYVLATMPIYFISTLVVPVFQNMEVGDLSVQFLILGCTFIVSIIGIWLNWRYGLKNYEAFG